MKIFAISLTLLSIGVSAAFTPIQHTSQTKQCPSSKSPLFRPSSSTHLSSLNTQNDSKPSTPSPAESNDAPPLKRKPPRKVCLMVEPTPFTHVSGYSNRFNEMLRYMSKAGDDFEILTVDSNTPEKDLPTERFGYPISHTQGFTFPLYNHISLTLDLPELRGAKILEKMKPDIIHVSSP